MTGRIVQLSTSPGGVPKRPVLLADVGKEGIAGDAFAHPQFHGGPEQALLLISNEVLESLQSQGFPVYPGALGENVTTAGLDYAQLRLGMRLRAGEVFLELTKLRSPCATLNVYNREGQRIQPLLQDAAAKKGDVTSPVWGHGGFYARILQSGAIRPGDSITLVEQVA